MSNPFILYVFMFLSCLIICANNSLTTRKMYGEIASPCLHPRSSLNHEDITLFMITLDFIFVLNNLIQLRMFSGKLKNMRDL